MSNLATVLSLVQEHVIDENAEVAGNLILWIQRAQQELEDAHDFRAMEAEHPLTTTVSTRVLGSKPSNWLRMRDDPWYYDGIGTTHAIRWILSGSGVPKHYSLDPVEKGPPQAILEKESAFEVYPNPDGLAPAGTLSSDGEYRVVIPYSARLATMSFPGNTNWFAVNAKWFLVWRATHYAIGFQWDDMNETKWGKLSMAEMKRLIRNDNVAKVPSRLIIRPRTGVLGRSYRR